MKAAFNDYWHALYKDKMDPIGRGDNATFKASCQTLFKVLSNLMESHTDSFLRYLSEND